MTKPASIIATKGRGSVPKSGVGSGTKPATRGFLSWAVHGRPTIERRGRRPGPALRRLPPGGVDRARRLPGDEARQADPRRGPRGRRQDRAREGAGRLPGPPARAPAVLRG